MHLRFKSKEILLSILALFMLGETSIAKNKGVIEVTMIDSLIFTGATNNNISDSTNWDYDALSFEIALQNATAEIPNITQDLVVEDSLHFIDLEISNYNGTIHLNDNFSADELRISNAQLSFESNLPNRKGVYALDFIADSCEISLDTSILISSNVLVTEEATIIVEDNISGIASDSIIVSGNYIDYVGTYTKLLQVDSSGYYFTLGTSIIDSIFIEPSGTLENHSIGKIMFQSIRNNGILINENVLNGGQIKNNNNIANSGAINTMDFINDGNVFNFEGTIDNTGSFYSAGFISNFAEIISDTFLNIGDIENNFFSSITVDESVFSSGESHNDGSFNFGKLIIEGDDTEIIHVGTLLADSTFIEGGSTVFYGSVDGVSLIQSGGEVRSEYTSITLEDFKIVNGFWEAGYTSFYIDSISNNPTDYFIAGNAHTYFYGHDIAGSFNDLTVDCNEAQITGDIQIAGMFNLENTSILRGTNTVSITNSDANAVIFSPSSFVDAPMERYIDSPDDYWYPLGFDEQQYLAFISDHNGNNSSYLTKVIETDEGSTAGYSEITPKGWEVISPIENSYSFSGSEALLQDTSGLQTTMLNKPENTGDWEIGAIGGVYLNLTSSFTSIYDIDNHNGHQAYTIAADGDLPTHINEELESTENYMTYDGLYIRFYDIEGEVMIYNIIGQLVKVGHTSQAIFLNGTIGEIYVVAILNNNDVIATDTFICTFKK